jgi:hypothetical protein
LGSLAITLIFCAGYLDARADSTLSWVGESSLRVKSTADFLRSSRIDLSKSQGIVAVIGDAQVLRFDWMDGAFFNMIGSDDLEARIVDSPPESLPDGFQVVKWSNNSLHTIAAAESYANSDAATLPDVNFSVTTDHVYAGTIPTA